MRKTIVLAVALLVLSLPGAMRNAIADTIQNESLPISLYLYVPCANGGAGEFVFLSGPLHVMYNITVDQAGGAHVNAHFQPQGISGYGLTTGSKYQANGETQQEFNFGYGLQTSYENNFRIIGQGPGNNFTVHENLHITINANGDLSSFVDNYNADCR